MMGFLFHEPVRERAIELIAQALLYSFPQNQDQAGALAHAETLDQICVYFDVPVEECILWLARGGDGRAQSWRAYCEEYVRERARLCGPKPGPELIH